MKTIHSKKRVVKKEQHPNPHNFFALIRFQFNKTLNYFQKSTYSIPFLTETTSTTIMSIIMPSSECYCYEARLLAFFFRLMCAFLIVIVKEFIKTTIGMIQMMTNLFCFIYDSIIYSVYAC